MSESKLKLESGPSNVTERDYLFLVNQTLLGGLHATFTSIPVVTGTTSPLVITVKNLFPEFPASALLQIVLVTLPDPLKYHDAFARCVYTLSESRIASLANGKTICFFRQAFDCECDCIRTFRHNHFSRV